MKRRRLILLGVAAAPALSPDEGAPTDEGRLNRFAETYNAYVEALRRGIIDLKAWGRAKRAWEALTR